MVIIFMEHHTIQSTYNTKEKPTPAVVPTRKEMILGQKDRIRQLTPLIANPTPKPKPKNR